MLFVFLHPENAARFCCALHSHRVLFGAHEWTNHLRGVCDLVDEHDDLHQLRAHLAVRTHRQQP